MQYCDLGRVVAISPHLDDVVFGCGALLAGGDAAVVTVFAGIPNECAVTAWDRAGGFSSAREAVTCRRAEDRKALQVLGARAVWLCFLDAQYGEAGTADMIASQLTRVLDREAPQTVLLPLGLYHSDHKLAHEACLLVRQCVSGLRWIAYEDALYRRRQALLQRRLAGLLSEGVLATPLCISSRGDGKLDAMRCYASQLRALGSAASDEITRPEGFWLLEDA